MRAHIVRSRRQVAVHGRTPAVAARMPPAVLLVINLRIGAAADCCCFSSSSLLLPDSVKPQRCSEACRIRAVWYLLRLSAFRPGDRSWMVRWSSPSSIELRVPLGLKGWALGRLRLKRLKTGLGRF